MAVDFKVPIVGPRTASQYSGDINEELMELFNRAPAPMTVTGTANAIVGARNPAFPSLVDGQSVWLSPIANNTGAVTLDVDGFGARPILSQSGAAVSVASMIATGSLYLLRYESAAGGAWRVVGSVSGGGGAVVRTYTASATWTKPANLVAAKVTAVGSGSVGGNALAANSAGSGGGGGGTAIKWFSASALPATANVVVAAFSDSIFAQGLGIAVTGGAGTGTGNGSGGTATGGDINIPGQHGDSGIFFNTTGTRVTIGGQGGCSTMGSGGQSSNGVSVGRAAQGYGGGGGGAANNGPLSTTTLGGAATSGIVIVEEFY